MSEAMENDRRKPSRPRVSTRRRIIRRGITTVAAVSGTSAALRPMLAAKRGAAAAAAPGTLAADVPATTALAGLPAPGVTDATGAAGLAGAAHDGAQHAASRTGRAAAPGAGAALFDEVYRGRRIQGFSSAMDCGVDIRIDGRPLHVMRRVDGSFISLANHYQPYPTALGTARGAVDVIGRAELSTAVDHDHPMT